jgi:hypothetical protein
MAARGQIAKSVLPGIAVGMFGPMDPGKTAHGRRSTDYSFLRRDGTRFSALLVWTWFNAEGPGEYFGSLS